ncbi:ubiquinone/menaquinone biosynthesis methyltransferase UbiE (plasmid) [Sinorhizobium americanum CCGM7]|uniref:class I SAM-dependent methyltransferase n=1 Tax=Sinorhizobium americanum TaxID=194963 RepID=UPI0004D6E954|nr:class I SAM-dependent methyltransferase [Sinorhizobium americanum]APG86636.1 ubiquinone/menaquinone biosynthesis methyltransferase UbiE [Sinorhizobium americanum CCGM7]
MVDSPLAVIRSFRQVEGLRILDVGCGNGRLARELIAAGADAWGIDPEPSAIHTARETASGGKFTIASAEALPFASGSFDVALMVNSLHHVPEPLMSVALRESVRVLDEDGLLVVVEPLTSGNFFEALRLVEDETVVRRAAQAAIEAELSSGDLTLVNTFTYVRTEAFGSPEQFLERVVAVDPSRLEVVSHLGFNLESAVLASAKRGADRSLLFDQPMKVHVIERGPVLKTQSR